MAGQPGPEGTAQAHHVSVIASASFGLRTGPDSQCTRPVAHSLSLDKARHRVPLPLRTPGTPCRSGVAKTSSCSCCTITSPHSPKPPCSSPTPSCPPTPTQLYRESPTAQDSQISLLGMRPGHPDQSHFPRPQTRGAHKTRPTTDEGWALRDFGRPALGSPGPTDQSRLESQLPTSTSGPASAPAGEPWQAAATGTTELLACDIRAGVKSGTVTSRPEGKRLAGHLLWV